MKKDYIGIYKANKNNNGAVAQWKLAQDKSCMFLELAKQVRPMEDSKPYDWDGTKIVVKLGETDIGKLLALFNGILPRSEDPNKDDLMLYHQSEKGSKIVKLKIQERGYYLKVSIKEGDRQDQIALPIAWDEAELLKIALTRGFTQMLGW
jgi:hypothetical protein